MVDLSSLSRLVKNNDPTTYYLKLSPAADIPAIRNYLAPHKDSGISLATVGEAIPDSVIYLQVAIFALAGILIVIALVNVLIMSLLAAQEKDAHDWHSQNRWDDSGTNYCHVQHHCGQPGRAGGCHWHSNRTCS